MKSSSPVVYVTNKDNSVGILNLGGDYGVQNNNQFSAFYMKKLIRSYNRNPSASSVFQVVVPKSPHARYVEAAPIQARIHINQGKILIGKISKRESIEKIVQEIVSFSKVDPQIGKADNLDNLYAELTKLVLKKYKIKDLAELDRKIISENLLEGKSYDDPEFKAISLLQYRNLERRKAYSEDLEL
ncbi:hypothetical protein NMY3_00381 [Candidatus Nitrosocosmicus oleophilus]|uniref:Uncharacterized protein n=1 Tax=Candidatus Nitrosocosmicus oleophilus TaxID=1353260 RepID=A0A654LTM3_9ARCH|nr:hypothetical protein [Candidatus Nitrosocosmicus oleophilus]ALI34595.1 hypothetical protein NMY3_00381 [Candidatus Nitrosocosmicus oleophilus]